MGDDHQDPEQREYIPQARRMAQEPNDDYDAELARMAQRLEDTLTRGRPQPRIESGHHRVL